MTLTETYFVIKNTIRNITVQIRTANGWIANSTPHRVATPFPPLKLWYIGKIWPTTAQNPNTKIPIYSIMFGGADESQLQPIANLTNAKVFDGKTNLVEAFKEVRGYN